MLKAPVSWVGLSLLVLGRIREAQRDASGAANLFSEALMQLPATLVESHPAVREARERLGGRIVSLLFCGG
jgi:hypothetical protein